MAAIFGVGGCAAFVGIVLFGADVFGDGSGSGGPKMSADGRIVVFVSADPSGERINNVPKMEIFLYDRATGRTERASVSSSGADAQNHASNASVGGNGRFVVFSSGAANLLERGTNKEWNVFVRDRETGTTRRVSVSSEGVPGDRPNGGGVISADGSVVVFYSDADNLAPGDTNGVDDVFVHDLRTGRTERISVSSGGVPGNGGSLYPVVSADGRFVAFHSKAGNLVPGDSNQATDVFVRDRVANTTRRVSVSSAGVEGVEYSASPAISADGRFVAFDSRAYNLTARGRRGGVDVYVRDREKKTTVRASNGHAGARADNASSGSSISSAGRFVAFASSATNLVAGDRNKEQDIFVFDLHSGTTERVSVSSDGIEGNGSSGPPSVSADGRFVAFSSDATNLVPGDDNGVSDIFVRDRLRGVTERVSGRPVVKRSGK